MVIVLCIYIYMLCDSLMQSFTALTLLSIHPPSYHLSLLYTPNSFIIVIYKNTPFWISYVGIYYGVTEPCMYIILVSTPVSYMLLW